MKKFLLVGLLVVVALVGTIGGVAFADDEDTAVTTTTSPLLERVAEILGVDVATLEDAVAQARSEMQLEARQTILDRLVEEGVITQEEADEYGEWLNDCPNLELGSRLQNRIGNARMSQVSAAGEFGGQGGRMGRFGGFGGLCPQVTE